ncbi:DUF3575 domain-containing protein [Chitinophaga silvatica]|uniref:DUF3575 domain-containing protein n=2 Tax=Chitinophaga silvatica TaxID=2282649 RepID=A0A3E1Y480_9BACT|nr:DUF3575 domain-containing protein [Chitinophaga silvatica]
MLHNIVKVNLSSLALNNYSVYFERCLTKKISATLGVRIMPNTALNTTLVGVRVADLLQSDNNNDYINSNVNNQTFTLGVRFYTGHKPGARGFYTELYGRYGNFGINYPYNYTTGGKDYYIPVTARYSGLGGGILLGSQFMISRHILMDIYIIGAHYGKMTGSLDARADLSSMSNADKQLLRYDLEGLAPALNNKQIITVQDVDNSGAKGKIDGPFLGVRALGFSIGYAFGGK